MNKKKFSKLPIMTPFRTNENKGCSTIIKLPLFFKEGVPFNGYCLEDKNIIFISDGMVYPIDIIAEELNA